MRTTIKANEISLDYLKKKCDDKDNNIEDLKSEVMKLKIASRRESVDDTDRD